MGRVQVLFLVVFHLCANFITFAVTLEDTQHGCIFSDLDSCRTVNSSSPCRCPCVPKCCPPGFVVATEDPSHADAVHGIRCIRSSTALLPQVPLMGRVAACAEAAEDGGQAVSPANSSSRGGGGGGGGAAAALRFYHSVLPMCQGMGGEGAGESQWRFDVHPAGSFTLDADYREEYVLHLHGRNKSKLVSNFDNFGERSGRLTAMRLRGGAGEGDPSRVVGFKPLMYFCFDLLQPPRQGDVDDGKDTTFETVAVTCPKSPLGSNKIQKCCPPGQEFSGAGLGSCKVAGSGRKRPWMLPINGHLYSEEELMQKGFLDFQSSKSFFRQDPCRHSNDSSSGGDEANDDNDEWELYNDYDAFHVGPDGRLHFTETHAAVGGSADFCVDQLYDQEEADGDQEGCEKTEHDEEYYSDDDYVYEDYGDEEYEEGDYDSDVFAKKMSSYDCHKNSLKPHMMVARYCHRKIRHVRKCCGVNQTLNLRARSCTSDLSRAWEMPAVHRLGADGVPVPVEQREGEEPRLLPWHIPSLVSRGRRLFVSDDNVTLLRDGRVVAFGGRVFAEGSFCLDYCVDYCGGRPSATLRAVIDDPALAHSTASAIFGTNKEDSPASLAIKRAGYPISIAFLVVTLLVFLVIPDLRKDLHGKMVICIVFCQVVVFTCLFVGTFPSYEVSRSNWKCVAQAAFTYYFILCSFGWMSAMSYNILSKFRVTVLLPRDADGRRFAAYSACCFLLPVIPLLAVLAIDRNFNFYGKAGQLSRTAEEMAGFLTEIRPGFGEESCWFTSCSKSLSYFLYGPISVILLSNAAMFAFAALRLRGMRRRIQRGAAVDRGSLSQRQLLSRTTSTAASEAADDVAAGGPDDHAGSTAEAIKRRFARQMSTLSAGVVSLGGARANRRRVKYNANRESLLTYLKLFAAMGLTWTQEIVAWCLSDDDKPPPQAVVITLNILNIFQGLIIFLVFTMKPATAQKIRQILSARFGAVGIGMPVKAADKRQSVTEGNGAALGGRGGIAVTSVVASKSDVLSDSFMQQNQEDDSPEP